MIDASNSRLIYVLFWAVLILSTGYLVLRVTPIYQNSRRKHKQLIKAAQEYEKLQSTQKKIESQFNSLLRDSTDAMFVCEKSIITFINARALDFLGYQDQEKNPLTHICNVSPVLQPTGDYSYLRFNEMLEATSKEGQHFFQWEWLRADCTTIRSIVKMTKIEFAERAIFYVTLFPKIASDKNESPAIALGIIDGTPLATSVFNHTADGILITNSDAKIIAVNPAFTHITGFSAEDVIGKNPSVLKSGRHTVDFYQEMWNSIHTRGVWQGEIWNKKKNGDIFPEWQTITSVKDHCNKLVNYVSIFSDITVIKRSQDALEHLAHFDALTDLPNRSLFVDRALQAFALAKRNNKKVAVLLLDLDGFKTVNDSLGHPIGDQLLKLVAERLKLCIRTEDTIARLGGDEFGILITNLESASDVSLVSQSVLIASRTPFVVQEHSVIVGASIGIAVFPDDGRDVNDLIRNADTAMYASKNNGRNSYHYYQLKMTLEAQHRLNFERELRSAIEREEFEVWYQPQIEISSGAYIGAEALIRWRNTRKELIQPDEFIPLVEQNGMILQIGEFVLRQTCSDYRTAMNSNRNMGRIAVNVSGPQLHRTDFIGTVTHLIEEFKLPSNALSIEVTETFMMENPKAIQEILTVLRSFGITTAIDDFGTGYSSLQYLKELPIDKLKIDRCFLKGLPENKNDVAIIHAILALGKSMNFNVIAEGIETEAQLQFLQNEGCKEGQGFMIASPMPYQEFLQWLDRKLISERLAETSTLYTELTLLE